MTQKKISRPIRLLMAVAAAIIRVARWHVPAILWAIVGISFVIAMLIPSYREHSPSLPLKFELDKSLQVVGKAMEEYRMLNGGYAPFDERGPLHSLCLLYPDYIPTADYFEYPRAKPSLFRHEQVSRFPKGTSLAGVQCHFGYTWHVPKEAAANFAIAATMPDKLTYGRKTAAWLVLYNDSAVRFEPTPFCSADPADNIFAPERGWSADTDSYIRQKP